MLNSLCCISQSAHLLSSHLSTKHFKDRGCLCGLFWRVLIVLVWDVWRCQPSLDRVNQQSFLWMQALKGLEERASYVHFWLELLLRGWWSLGQRLQWAGNHYMKPSVLTGVFRQLQRLATFISSHNLTLGKEWSQTYEQRLLWLKYYPFFAFSYNPYSWVTQIKKSISHYSYAVVGSWGLIIWKSYMQLYTYILKTNKWLLNYCN